VTQEPHATLAVDQLTALIKPAGDGPLHSQLESRLRSLIRSGQVPAGAELPGGVPVGLLHHLELRIDPATAGWVAGHPGGSLDVRGWVRFADGRAADPLSLLQVVDGLPPASFDLGLPGWAPTVELTVYLRGLPAPGWLGCVVRGQLWQGGWFDEEAEVWDSAGRLVAQSRQLAGARPAPAPGAAPSPDRWAAEALPRARPAARSAGSRRSRPRPGRRRRTW
jgi:hypothetical protein